MVKNKNIILFIGTAPLEDVAAFRKKHPKQYRLALGYINNPSTQELAHREKVFDIVFKINLTSETTILKSLRPYLDELLAVTCRSEATINQFAKIIPFLPYLRTPSAQSLLWSVDKLSMRKRFKSYKPKITPRYKIVSDSSQETIHAVQEKVGFPLIVKPTGLASSLLVSICYHEEELEKNLRAAFRKIKSLNKTYKKGEVEEAKLLVEEFMDGDMYSIDGYVNSRGKIYFCPMVAVTTGRGIGFDDFFGYKQITPTALKLPNIKTARSVATDAIHALGLRSSSAHVELMKTEDGWKVIEVGPRVGGFRNIMYKLSFNIDHTENDIFIRIPKKPRIPKKRLGYTAAMKFFAKKEGAITSIAGMKKAQELSSFKEIHVNKKIGDKAHYAKNGGKSVFNIILHNAERSKLLADIRRLESYIKIETK